MGKEGRIHQNSSRWNADCAGRGRRSSAHSLLQRSRRSRAGSCSHQSGSTHTELHYRVAEPGHDHSDAAPLTYAYEAQTTSAEPAAAGRQNDLPALSGGRVLRSGGHSDPRGARHRRPGHDRGRGIRPGRAVCVRGTHGPACVRIDHHHGAAVPSGLPTVHKRHFAADSSGLSRRGPPAPDDVDPGYPAWPGRVPAPGTSVAAVPERSECGRRA